jgi:hypothetical protein
MLTMLPTVQQRKEVSLKRSNECSERKDFTASYPKGFPNGTTIIIIKAG